MVWSPKFLRIILIVLTVYILRFQCNFFQLLKGSSVHILPVMNPDGVSKAKIGDCESEVGKNNAHGVDLDVNFIGKKKF